MGKKERNDTTHTKALQISEIFGVFFCFVPLCSLLVFFHWGRGVEGERLDGHFCLHHLFYQRSQLVKNKQTNKTNKRLLLLLLLSHFAAFSFVFGFGFLLAGAPVPFFFNSLSAPHALRSLVCTQSTIKAAK